MLLRPLAAGALLDAVRDLQRDAARTRFPLHLPGSVAATRSRDRLVDQLVEHLVPRLTQLAAPAVVVVAGSTGAGKSTLVNSLVRAEVSEAGVLRPTTRRAVLVHHPADAGLLAHHPVHDDVTVVVHEAVPRGIALLDAPDLDSVVAANRVAAHRLLESADLWLFVTTATRYGDALPWQVLTAAVERGTTIAMVLNRVPPKAVPQVRRDLQERMREHGLGDSPLFAVPEVGPQTGLLDPRVIAPIARWVSMLAGRDRARAVVARTLRGSLAALRTWVDELAEAVQDQADAAQRLAVAIEAALAPVHAGVDASLAAGAPADGGARARWVQLTARGGALARVLGRRGTVRGSARAARARGAAVRPLLDDLSTGVVLAVVAAGERARDAVVAACIGPSAPRGGAALLAAADGPDDALRRSAAEQAAAHWVADGLSSARTLLGQPGGAAAGRAQVRDALGTDTLGAVLLAAAGGVAAAAELATAVLGQDAVEPVAALRAGLAERLHAAVEAERLVYDPVLADPDLAADASARLRLRLAVLKRLT